MLFFNISAFYFFYFAAVGIYVIFLPKVLNDLGYNAFDIGTALAIAPLMKFLMPFLFLKHINLSQSMFKKALFITVLAVALFYITIEHFYLFMLNNAILAACLSLILPYLEVTTVIILGKDRYGKARLFGSIGFMIIALVLAKFLTTPFVALHYYLAIVVLTVLFALLLLKNDLEEKINQISDETFSFFKYLAFWISIFFMQVSFGGFYNFFTIYEIEHGLSLETISYLWAFGVICEILMLYFQAPILKNNLLTIIKFCIGVTAFRWLLLYLYPNSIEIVFFTQAIHAFSFALFHSAVVIYLYSLYDNKKLAQQFLFGVGYGFGAFIGALFAGAVYGKYLFLFSFIFAFFSFVAICFVKKERI
ncbi:MFS transporter [Aliarcobacter trophiarum LMG 25534]|uniref:MFS transporter n=1 Tax=Aliarcobacter trophiarum LMG 25534 TaxID=1032241 RepID=A0AAD0QM88_9BACT|nr:MFS transporter [Aliarcobacter trophiarum]AXK49716.1 putative major facilitator superfamily transporter [Aliarcobacter trophiarum LMG 25534]RXI28040.1 MFS transporter [Aliarcobacter trophiarum]RXJ92506.1 MFS transporter [Aliarcobacter trophiarum LMG 25534]